MTFVRVRWVKEGGHIHCRVFSSQTAGGTFAKNGDLVFDEREWPEVRAMLSSQFELIEDFERSPL